MSSKRKAGGSVLVKNPFAETPPVKKKVISKVVPVEAEDVIVEKLGNDNDKGLKDEPQFNLFVGTDLGILKGIGFGEELPVSKNIFKPDIIPEKAPAVVSLSWGIGDEDEDDNEKELLVAFSNHVVKTYNKKLRCFTRQTELEIKPEETKLTGLCPLDSRNYVFGLEDGTLAMWNLLDLEVSLKIKTGDNMCKVRQCPSDKNLYATGGKECDLKLWNVCSETPEVPVFQARNVPHDFLDLRIPVWVQDLTFLPRTTEVLALGSRYGHVRLYDVREHSRRPVSNVEAFDHPIMSISSTHNDRQVVVGTSQGVAGLFDLRNPKKEKLLRKFRGYSGGIRCVEACSEKPYFTSCGLDKHLYVHNFNKSAPVKKLYMKQRLNCIALSKTFIAAIDKEPGNDVSTSVTTENEGDWANISPEVLDLNPSPLMSPSKKLRKLLRS